jgi:hypothetical protein
MAISYAGSVSLQEVGIEIGLTTLIDMDHTRGRNLAGDTTTGQPISMSDFIPSPSFQLGYTTATSVAGSRTAINPVGTPLNIGIVGGAWLNTPAIPVIEDGFLSNASSPLTLSWFEMYIADVSGDAANYTSGITRNAWRTVTATNVLSNPAGYTLGTKTAVWDIYFRNPALAQYLKFRFTFNAQGF